jgi:hypothetical protein
MRYENLPKLTTWTQDSATFATTSRVAAIRAAWGTLAAAAVASAPTGRLSLANIDALLGDYDKAITPMSKTNLLAELENAISAWHKANPGKLPLAMAALKEVVDRRLGLRASASRYNKVICIGYNIYCNYDKTAFTVHDDPDLNTSYFRRDNDDQIDMQIKCALLWNAIVAAHAAIPNIPLANDNRTLKIFMAPEFYFRGKHGAYSFDIVNNIIPTMQRLGTTNPIFKDWLFVFGTGVAAFQTAITYCKTCGLGKSTIRYDRDPANRAKTIAKCSKNPAHVPTTGTYGAEVQNIALIQHGSDTHMVAKEYVSGIDYKKNDAGNSAVTLNGQKRTALAPEGSRDDYHRRGPAVPIKTDERVGGCIFNIDGVCIGLEVCLDHALGPDTNPYGRASAYAGTIQILLIPSYGMAIGQGLHCKPGGIAFNVDGRGMGSSEVKINIGAADSEAWYNIACSAGSLSVYPTFNIPA